MPHWSWLYIKQYKDGRTVKNTSKLLDNKLPDEAELLLDETNVLA